MAMERWAVIGRRLHWHEVGAGVGARWIYVMFWRGRETKDVLGRHAFVFRLRRRPVWPEAFTECAYVRCYVPRAGSLPIYNDGFGRSARDELKYKFLI